MKRAHCFQRKTCEKLLSIYALNKLGLYVWDLLDILEWFQVYLFKDCSHQISLQIGFTPILHRILSKCAFNTLNVDRLISSDIGLGKKDRDAISVQYRIED